MNGNNEDKIQKPEKFFLKKSSSYPCVEYNPILLQALIDKDEGGRNRGYGRVEFCRREDAERVVQMKEVSFSDKARRTVQWARKAKSQVYKLVFIIDKF